MHRIAIAALAGAALVVTLSSQQQALEIWFIDVEGGQSTLIVTPAGESLLIDAGYSPSNRRGGGDTFPDGRDPSRIAATLQQAGVSRIDYLLITHFHPDHAGGVPLLAARVPIGTFIDYGMPLDTPYGADRLSAGTFVQYERVRTAHPHLVARAGDRLPLKGVQATVVSAGGELVAALPGGGGGGANPACNDLEDHAEDGTENFRSIGVLFEFGAFRFYDPGDLSGNALTRVACPVDRLGQVSAYLIAHHGDYDTSIPALYAALRPRVAIMNNGAVKGGNAVAFKAVRGEAAIEDLWQLHRSENDGVVNAEEPFIANVDDGTQTSHPLKLTAFPDGSFRIVNPRTDFHRTYPAATVTTR